MKSWIDAPFDGEEIVRRRAPKDGTADRVDIRMRPIYKDLVTNKIPYFCLFRNNDMDLEALKSDQRNVAIFVGPLAEILINRGVKNVAPAPKGDHTRKNGFHFATEVVARAAKISGSKVWDPFLKGRTVTKKDTCPEDIVIVDDIITRGRTIAACLRTVKAHGGVIILLTNH